MVRAQMQSASFRRHSATMHAVARCANQLHQSRMNTQAGRPRWLLAWEMGSGMGHWAGLTAIASRAIAAGIEVVMVVPNLAPSGLAAPPGARVIACPPLVVHGNEAGGTSSMAELLALHGFAHASTLIPILRAWRDLMTLIAPDAVVVDHAPAALAVAQALHIPVVQLGTGFAIPPAQAQKLPPFRTWETPDGLAMTRAEIDLVQSLGHAARALDLPALPQSAAAIYRAPAVLRTIPPLDHYRDRPAGALYCGPLEVAGETSQAPPLWPVLPGGPRRRVVAYLKADDPLAVPVMQALAARQDVVVHAYVANLRGLDNRAPNVTVHGAPLPLKPMLPDTDLLVHHGGAGAASQALLAGVPQLMIPQMAEQFLTARQVDAAGAGQLLWGRLTAADVVRSLDHALTAPTLRARAQALAQENAEFTGDNGDRAWQMLQSCLVPPA